MSIDDTLDAEADRLDREIGGRLRLARKERGLTQTELGAALGVTFQQVQKYERGANRVSGSALVLLSRTLNISPLELLGENDQAADSGIDWDLLAVEGAHELLAQYRGIPSARLRRLVLDLARELAATAG